MIRAIFILILIVTALWCYQNWNQIKDDTVNLIQNEKTIKKFNINKDVNKEYYDSVVNQ